MSRTTAVRESSRTAPSLAALGTIQGGAAAIGVTLAVFTGIFAQTTDLLERLLLPPAAIVVVLALITIGSTFLYIRAWLREVRRPRGTTVSVFVGAEPFTEDERDRFFGRKAETDEIVRKLRNREVRFLVLFGQSGCGKTSLIQAGVMPALRSEGTKCVYTRPYGQPEQSLKKALGKLGRQRGVVFIDQFEELFTAKVDGDERRRFVTAIGECIANRDGRQPQLVFALRYEFFARLTEIEEYVGDLVGSSRRARIVPFTVENARTIIEESLAHDGASWDPVLIDRVLEDLRIDAGDSIAGVPIVLPAELQIVCQMIQRRGWSDARQYPGKERLIRDYVNDAIETSPNGEQTKRILLKLIHENGLTRSEPRTAADIADDIGSVTETVAAKHLEHLDRNCRLVNQVHRKGTVAYELAHEYLVDVINQISGLVMDRARRANVLLQEYRSRARMNDRLRIPFSEAWLIRRHATEAITPADRRLLYQSLRGAAVRATVTTVVPVAIVLVLRFGTVHFDYWRPDHDPSTAYMIVRRGLPILAPVLGSDQVVLDAGDMSDYSGGFLAARRRQWIWDFPTLSRTNAFLRRWRVASLREHEAYADDNPDDRFLNAETPDELAILRETHSPMVMSRLRTESMSSGPGLMALRRLGVRMDAVAAELRSRLTSKDTGEHSPAALALLQMSPRNLDVAGLVTIWSAGCESPEPSTSTFDPPPLAIDSKLGREHAQDIIAAVRSGIPEPIRAHLLKKSSGEESFYGCAVDTLIALGRTEEVAGALTAALSRNINAADRVLAAERLLSIDPASQPATYAIIGALGDPSTFLVAAAAVQSRGVRHQYVEGLLLANLDVRKHAWAAAKALIATGHRSDPLFSFLERRMRSHRPFEAVTACELWVEADGAQHVVHPALLQLLDDPDDAVARRAARALVRLRSVPEEGRKRTLSLRLGVATSMAEIEELRAAGYSSEEIEEMYLNGAKKNGFVTPLALEVFAARGNWSRMRGATRQALIDSRMLEHPAGELFARLELIRPREPVDAALRRLRDELATAGAARSQALRHAIEYAIATVVISHMRRAGIKDPADFERALLEPREDETIVVRRALRNAVRRIDEQIPLADIASFR